MQATLGWRSLAAALLVSAVLLVAVALPAEYGIDPLGSGAWLGLTRPADVTVAAVTPAAQPYREDEVSFHLDPFQSVEYKYRLAAGAGFVYTWEADAEVLYELHGHAEDDPQTVQSYRTGRVRADSGFVIAPLTGIHGWFWQNRNTTTVEIRLHAAGFADASVVISDRGEHWRELVPASVDVTVETVRGVDADE